MISTRTKANEINSCHCPFEEKGIAELLTAALKTGRFKAQTGLRPEDVFAMAVPTPHENKNAICPLFFRPRIACFPHHRLYDQAEDL
ncbi:hypothetical protein AB8Z38_34325 [Bradyrhizobium sp. LLZ17]|uniref:Uncharacterized protein n=1 Tax=Bradyrhizobium sp. LLZ17 TaxID=3239388 RepID=A0AB39XML9_9BRAD